ncbi:hypothetical protein ACFOD9_14040 [Novosphingobium bradum]|uniref:Biopolymer transporter ExbD n=1 Tax=Novosphingobium bradum TaxID=1737444 RepID=A0ABV7IYS2_9SPHN
MGTALAARADTGWQYALADLSLILFMVCALALAQAPKGKAHPAPPPPPPARAEAVALGEAAAVWRAGPGMPSLAEWIAGQAADPRQRLTIVARYSQGRAAEAFARADAALQGVRKRPASARIVVEPGAQDDLGAMLTWDVGQT